MHTSTSFIFRLALLACLLLAGAPPAASARSEKAAEPAVQAPLPPGERLVADAGGRAAISLSDATGTARFVRVEPGALPYSVADGDARRTPDREALRFLQDYRAVFGLRDPAQELHQTAVTQDSFGFRHVEYRQLYQGVPVFAGLLRVHFDSQGRLTAANGTFIPKIDLDPQPGLSPQEAADLALVEVARTQAASSTRLGPVASPALEAETPSLYVYRTNLARDLPGRNHLVYEVAVSNGLDRRDLVYVDAHTGAIVDRVQGVETGMSRRLFDGTSSWPATPYWVEGQPLPAGEPLAILQYTEDAYNMFGSMSGGTFLSYDGADAVMDAVFNLSGAGVCPNAFWNGAYTAFCPGLAVDDIVVHEWAHAYTDGTHDLIYQWQPGALNEAYSDIWGEVADLFNGQGLDSPIPKRTDGSCSTYGGFSGDASYRWLIGEEAVAPGMTGPIRDMWNPNCYDDPGRVSDPLYWCSAVDEGGVHANSGVPNHAFSLVVEGGNYNGYSLTGIGFLKAIHVYWRAQSQYQLPATDFADHADALEAACSDLIGEALPLINFDAPNSNSDPSGVTATDCARLSQVIAAVELRSEPAQCDFSPALDPNPPALCDGLGTVETIHLADWESGLSGWTPGARNVANPATFSTPDWAAVTGLPDGRPGRAAFVQDPILGDCLLDDETGVRYLESPALLIPASAEIPRAAFDHWFATELGYDGGNLKISVNGGAFELITTDRFEFNPYTGALESAGNTNPMAGEPAFNGADEGSVRGSWGQSQVNLAGLAGPGDTVRFRLEMGLDGCNGLTGWYVDDFLAYSCSAEVPGMSCGDAILDLDETCDDGNTADGDGCSATCQVETGYSCTAPEPPDPGTNVLPDGSFEAGSPNPFWAEASTNFGTPLCTTASCGGPGGSDGQWFAWFGGIPAYEAGSLEQTVVIPTTATTLQFDLMVGICDSAADYLNILVDGLPVFSTGACASAAAYDTRSVDIRGFADGGSHALRFASETFAANGGVGNFFVDRVALSDNVPVAGAPSVCTPDTYTSTADGAWNDPDTWIGSPPLPPSASKDVVISAGTAVTISVGPAQAGSVTIEPGGKLVVPDGVVLTVEGTFTNNGTLEMTRDASGDTAFHIFNGLGSAVPYYGLSLAPSGSSLGLTTVRIHGGQECTVDDPGDTVNRCFEISPAVVQPAQVIFYYLESERDGLSAAGMQAWHWDGSLWTPAGSLVGVGTAAPGVHRVTMSNVSVYSPFFLTDKPLGPTAVALKTLAARSAAVAPAAAGILAAGLLAGLALAWRSRRLRSRMG